MKNQKSGTGTLQDKVLVKELNRLVQLMKNPQEKLTDKQEKLADTLLDFCIKHPETAQQFLIPSLKTHFPDNFTYVKNEVLKTFFNTLLSNLFDKVQQDNDPKSLTQYAKLCEEIDANGPQDIKLDVPNLLEQLAKQKEKPEAIVTPKNYLFGGSYKHCADAFKRKAGNKITHILSTSNPLVSHDVHDRTVKKPEESSSQKQLQL